MRQPHASLKSAGQKERIGIVQLPVLPQPRAQLQVRLPVGRDRASGEEALVEERYPDARPHIRRGVENVFHPHHRLGVAIAIIEVEPHAGVGVVMQRPLQVALLLPLSVEVQVAREALLYGQAREQEFFVLPAGAYLQVVEQAGGGVGEKARLHGVAQQVVIRVFYLDLAAVQLKLRSGKPQPDGKPMLSVPVELQLVGIKQLRLSVVGGPKLVIGDKTAKTHVVVLIGVFRSRQDGLRGALKACPLSPVGQVYVQCLPGTVRVE